MTPELRRTFWVLAREALGDALRRRLVLAIGIASLLSLQLVNSCTSCGKASVTRDGQAVAMPEMAGMGALAVAIACTLWTLILAGALASDHLDEPLDDGSAALVLARPVGRATFALARLAGVLAIALVSGAVLLGGAGLLLHARQGLSLAPLLGAYAATAAGAATVGALAMAASISAPRIATLLAVLMSVGAVAAVNVTGLFGASFGVLATLIDDYGPPLVSSVAFALSDWIAPTLVPGNALGLALRHLVWLLASVALLIHAFRRIEID
jgi:hypothetical protein